VYVQTGKTFIVTLIAVALSLGGLAWLSSDGKRDVPAAQAQTSQQLAEAPAQTSSKYDAAAETSAEPAAVSNTSGYEEGYKAGYRDGHQDCTSTATSTRTSVARTRYTRTYARPRVRVAGTRYYAEPRRGHSTRDLILTIAAPAAIGAGIGGIARGGKGAGIGALLGGGGGALYHLFKNRRR